MSGKKSPLIFLMMFPNIAVAQSQHEIEVSNYVGFFRTSISNGPEVQILSPIGGQIGYAYHIKYTSSMFAQYNVLSTGKSIIMHGLNYGYEYAFFGGHNRTISIPRNTAIATIVPRRASAFSALAFRLHNLDGIVVPSNSVLRPTVPLKGRFVGVDLGIGYEESLANRFRFSLRTSVLIPKFLGQENQKGFLITLTSGVGATL